MVQKIISKVIGKIDNIFYCSLPFEEKILYNFYLIIRYTWLRQGIVVILLSRKEGCSCSFPSALYGCRYSNNVNIRIKAKASLSSQIHIIQDQMSYRQNKCWRINIFILWLRQSELTGKKCHVLSFAMESIFPYIQKLKAQNSIVGLFYCTAQPVMIWV